MERLGLAGAVTGIGSLPFADPQAALEAVAAGAPHLPFWPQLPSRGPQEGMLAQGLAGLEGLLAPGSGPWRREIRDRSAFLTACVRPQPWGPEQAAGLCAFEAALAAGAFPEARGVKGQLCGPLTLAASLELEGQPVWRDPAILRALGARVAAQAGDQGMRLRVGGDPVLIVVDEPGLGAVPSALLHPLSAATEALCWALAAISVTGAVAGLHCCATPPWAFVAGLPLDLLSFDADRDLEAMLADPHGRALAEEKMIAWGLVPTTEGPVDPDAVFARWLAAIPASLDPAALARNSLVTASCGLAGQTEAGVAASFRSAAAVGARLQALSLGSR